MTLFNLVQVHTMTAGNGPLTLGAAMDGGISFSVVPDGATVSYAIADVVNGVVFREVGRGVKTGSVLTRSMLTSTTGALLSLSGNANVSITALAEDFVSPKSYTSINRVSASALGGSRAVAVKADNKAHYTDGLAMETAQVVGVTVGAAAFDANVEIAISGYMEDSAWSWLEGEVYADQNGVLTQIEPSSGAVLLVGISVGPKSILIKPAHILDFE